MKEVQSTEAKAQFARLLSEVERGETVTITRDGKAVAHLVPAHVDDTGRRQAAVDALHAWRDTLPKTGTTVEDILRWRHEGHRF